MNTSDAARIIAQKEPPELYQVVEPVLTDGQLRDTIVAGSFDRNETIRYNCSRILFRALERQPQLFYPYWERFAEMIGSPNSFHRSVAAQAIAFLSPVDVDCRLDPLLKRYLALLDDPKVMAAHYFIDTLDRVYQARRDFRTTVVETLLAINTTHHEPPRKELLKADVIAIFDRIFDILPIKHQRRALSFANEALESPSGKTKKAAKLFIAKRSS